MIIHIDLDESTLAMLDGLCEAFQKGRDQVVEDALVYYANAVKPFDELRRTREQEEEEGGKD